MLARRPLVRFLGRMMSELNGLATWRWIVGLILGVTGAVIVALSVVVMNKLNQIDSLTMALADIKADIKIMQSDIKTIQAAASELKGKSEAGRRR